MSIYKTIFSDTILYGLVNSFSKLLSFFIFPLLATYFTVSEYGKIDYIQTFTTFLVLTLTFGLDSALVRFFYEEEENEKRKKLISEILAVQLIIIIIYLILAYLLETYIDEKLKINSKPITQVILLQVPFILIINFSQNILKWTFQRKEYIIVSIAYLSFILCYCLIGVYAFNFSVFDYFLGCIVIQFFFSIVSLFLIKKWLVSIVEFNYLKKISGYAAPLALVALTTASFPFLERNIVLINTSQIDLGIYSIVSKYCFSILILIYSFQVAWGPISYSIYKSKNASKVFNNVIKFFSFLICEAILFIYLIDDYIFDFFFDHKIERINELVFFMAFSIGIQGLNSMIELNIHLSKKTKWILFSNIIFLIIFLSSYLLSSLSLFNIVIITLVASIFKFLITILISQRIYKMKWNLSYVYFVILLTLNFGLYISIFSADQNSLVIYFLILNPIIYTVINLKYFKKLNFFQIKHK